MSEEQDLTEELEEKKVKKVGLAQIAEDLAHLSKMQKRQQRDLEKLRPIILQAPDAANKDADIISSLTDLMVDRIRTFLTHKFVTRNEFQTLENLLPATKASILEELGGV